MKLHSATQIVASSANEFLDLPTLNVPLPPMLTYMRPLASFFISQQLYSFHLGHPGFLVSRLLKIKYPLSRTRSVSAH